MVVLSLYPVSVLQGTVPQHSPKALPCSRSGCPPFPCSRRQHYTAAFRRAAVQGMQVGSSCNTLPPSPHPDLTQGDEGGIGAIRGWGFSHWRIHTLVFQ